MSHKNNNKPTEKKAVHPLSRKARQLTADVLRDVHKERHKHGKDRESDLVKEKLEFFKSKLEDGKKVYSNREITDLIQEYIDRTQPDPVELGSKARTNKHEFMMKFKENELKSFKNEGYPAPDLTKSVVVQWLKNWEGEKKYMDQARMRRFKCIATIEKEEDSKSSEIQVDSEPKKVSLRSKLNESLPSTESTNPFTGILSGKVL